MSIDPKELLSQRKLKLPPQSESSTHTPGLPIERVLLEIKLDCETDPEDFLEQTMVPYGGE